MNFYMIFEFCEHGLTLLLILLFLDLAGLIDAKITFKENEKKSIMKQILNGIFHCHQSMIIHRDIKGVCLLISFNLLLF
jgi:serine/threonine protein kinase